MKVFAKYISSIYLKYFFIIFIALELFVVGIDALNSLASLPKSANLLVLYLIFTAGMAVSIILPLSVVLSFIATFIHFLRSGELVAFYALGISKNRLIMPIFWLSCLITIAFIIFQCTPLAYAKDQKNFLKAEYQDDFKDADIFLKRDNKFIFLSKLSYVTKSAQSASIFEVENSRLTSIIEAKDVIFKDGNWVAKSAVIKTLPNEQTLGANIKENSIQNDYIVLLGFEPELLTNLNRNASSYSITHALSALWQMKDDNVNLFIIRSALYSSLIFPFFAPFMLLILYYYMPEIPRFANLALTSFISIVSTLAIWGVIYSLARISVSGTILPEIAIILPVLLIGLFAGHKYKKAKL